MTQMERRRIRVTGVVQGVGFRPFVYGLALRHALGGYVLNDGGGVVIEAEGELERLDAFAAALRAEAPALARVDTVAAEPLPPLAETEFRIDHSVAGGGTARDRASPGHRAADRRRLRARWGAVARALACVAGATGSRYLRRADHRRRPSRLQRR